VYFAPNLWPDRPSQLRPALVDYFTEVRTLAHRLTELFAAALHLPGDFFAEKTGHSTDTMRINHYERRPGEPDPLEGQMGMGAHTDYGVLTVLYADAVPGLQIVSPDGHWVDVLPEPGCLLVNLGDLTATWTNDHWRSTLHRVVPSPPGAVRRSAAFFHDGNYDALVECLPTCTSADDPPRYAPVTAGEHLLAKLLGPRTLSASNATVDTTSGRLAPS
jgi:isopenicillin N synthase-like dioxygenase